MSRPIIYCHEGSQRIIYQLVLENFLQLKPPPPSSKATRVQRNIMSHNSLSAATILKEVDALIDNPTYSTKECNDTSVQCAALVSYILTLLPSKCSKGQTNL